METVAEQEIRRLDKEASDYAASARFWLGMAMGGWLLAIVFGVMLVMR